MTLDTRQVRFGDSENPIQVCPKCTGYLPLKVVRLEQGIGGYSLDYSKLISVAKNYPRVILLQTLIYLDSNRNLDYWNHQHDVLRLPAINH